MDKPRILVVDDDRAHVASVSVLIARAGYAVRGESKVEDGLDALRRQRFDIVLMGYRFDHSAVTMTSVIGEFASAASSGLIMLTAFADMTIEADARLLGVTAFLVKPVTAAVLLLTIRELLADPGRPAYYPPGPV